MQDLRNFSLDILHSFEVELVSQKLFVHTFL